MLSKALMSGCSAAAILCMLSAPSRADDPKPATELPAVTVTAPSPIHARRPVAPRPTTARVARGGVQRPRTPTPEQAATCLLYTSDAADE